MQLLCKFIATFDNFSEDFFNKSCKNKLPIYGNKNKQKIICNMLYFLRRI